MRQRERRERERETKRGRERQREIEREGEEREGKRGVSNSKHLKRFLTSGEILEEGVVRSCSSGKVTCPPCC